MRRVRRANLFFLVVVILQVISPYFFWFVKKYTNLKSMNLSELLVGNQVLFLLCPIIIYFLITRESPKEVLRFNKVKIGDLGIVLLMAVLFVPVAGFLSTLTSLVVENNVEKVLKVMNPLPLYSMILIIALTPAMFEEFTLRGVILAGYKKIDIRKAAIMNGLFFSIIHFSIQQSLYTFAMGIIVAFVVYYTDSILTSMLFHFTINSISTVSSKLLASKGDYVDKAAKMQNTQFIKIFQIVFLGILAIAFTILIVLLIQALKKRNLERIQMRENENKLPQNQFEVTSPERKEKVFTWHVAAAMVIYIINVVVFPYIRSIT